MRDDRLPSDHEVLRQARAEGRQLFVEGLPWLVYEMAAQFDRRAAASLVFENEGTIRRVRDYPSNWRELSDEDLFALSWSR